MVWSRALFPGLCPDQALFKFAWKPAGAARAPRGYATQCVSVPALSITVLRLRPAALALYSARSARW